MSRAFLLFAVLFMPAMAQFQGWPPMPAEALQLLMKGDPMGMVALLRTGAEGGDPIAMLFLGRAFEEIERVPHDYPEAMRWYRRAADREVGVAAWSLGRLYEMGRGTPRDDEEAQKWYTKAAELGFRRTALTVIKLRWIPGDGELQYQPIPEVLRNLPPHPNPEMAFLHRPIPDLTTEELEALRADGLRGRLIWEGGEPGLFGLPARLILIAQKRVVEEVRLPLPLESSLFYVQKDDQWQRIGEVRTSEHHVRIHPQSADMPWITSVTLELEDGSTKGGLAWSWPR